MRVQNDPILTSLNSSQPRHRAMPSGRLLLAALLIFALLPAQTAWAHTILIDLGDNFSDMTAQNWNTIQFIQTVPDLIDDTGASTGVSFAPLFWGGDFQNSANWIEDTDWVLQEAATDHFGGFSNSTITFGNLDGIYKVEVVCAHPQTNHLTDITVNDAFSDGNFQNIPGVNGDDFDPEQDGRVAQNWLIWDAVTPVNGEITLRVIKLAGTNAISVSALRLTRVGDLGSSSVDLVTSANTVSLPEPSGEVRFDVQIDNTGDSSVDITSLTSDLHGNLDGQGDCSLPQNIAESGSYSCTYPATISGNAGDTITNTVSTSGSGMFGAVNDQSSTAIDILDVLPNADLAKVTSCNPSIEEPGGPVDFSVKFTNTSNEAVDLTDLFDDSHGDLDGQGTCSVPQTVAPGATYECSYSATVSGVAGGSETSTLTATFEDDEANIDTVQASATVSITAIGVTVFRDCFESGDLTSWGSSGNK